MPPSEISTLMAEEQRMKNYRSHLEQRNDIELREIEEKNGDELARTQAAHSERLEALRQDYDVQISKEAEQLEERLHQIRSQNEKKVEEERHQADGEMTKLRSANQQRIADYKKNSEAQLDALRKQLQASTDTLHEKSRKMAKKEGLGA